MSVRRLFSYIFIAVLSALFAYFLFWHYKLGVIRYFDVDEFTHLHWAHNILTGRRPFVDFLTFFPPGFHWFLVPLFWFGGGTYPVVLGRFVMFFLFAALCMTGIVLFIQMRGKTWVALLAGILLAFLPIPFDKTIEIRPDTLSTLLFFIGVIAQIAWMRKRRDGTKDQGNVAGVATGVFYSLSIIVLPKTLPQVGLAVIIAIASLVEDTLPRLFRSPKELQKISLHFLPIFLGLGLPMALFSLWALTLGNLSLVWYSLTRLPLESNRISETYVMSPDLFFYPNQIFYGQVGWAQGLLANHALWIIGIVVGLFRMLTPMIARGKKYVWEELLLSTTFFIQIILFVQYIPLKHTQYLIPIAVCIAWYVADGVGIVWEWARKYLWSLVLSAAVLLSLFYFLFSTFQLVTPIKAQWNNADTMVSMNYIYSNVPKNAYVFDLDGRSLYYKDPYYACCLPFGQFAGYLSRPLPPLIPALEATNTNYIFLGQLGRDKSLAPDDQTYIASNFEALGENTGLLVRKKK
jgi:hypothetical protein